MAALSVQYFNGGAAKEKPLLAAAAIRLSRTAPLAATPPATTNSLSLRPGA